MVLSLSVPWGPETASHRAPRRARCDQVPSVPCTHSGPSSPAPVPPSGTRHGTPGHRGTEAATGPAAGAVPGRDGRKRLFPTREAAKAGFFHQVLCLQQQEAKENKRHERRGTGGTCASGSCKQRRAVNAGRVMDVPEGPRRMCRTRIFPRPARPALPAAAGPTPPVPPSLLSRVLLSPQPQRRALLSSASRRPNVAVLGSKGRDLQAAPGIAQLPARGGRRAAGRAGLGLDK